MKVSRIVQISSVRAHILVIFAKPSSRSPPIPEFDHSCVRLIKCAAWLNRIICHRVIV
jgi:hypothetical protein